MMQIADQEIIIIVIIPHYNEQGTYNVMGCVSESFAARLKMKSKRRMWFVECESWMHLYSPFFEQIVYLLPPPPQPPNNDIMTNRNK